MGFFSKSSSDAQNLHDIGDYATTAQALGLNHEQRIGPNWEIEALYIDGHWIAVDSIEFADYVSEITASPDYSISTGLD